MDFNESQHESVQDFYGNRLRVRCCGLHVLHDQLLLVRHDLGKGDFWSPPGGGIQVGETAVSCLKREFAEETGLIVENCDFLFACEFIHEPLHAIELFFLIGEATGKLKVGTDPEAGSPQVILEARYLPWSQIARMDKGHLHGIFGRVAKPFEILGLRGYFTL